MTTVGRGHDVLLDDVAVPGAAVCHRVLGYFGEQCLVTEAADYRKDAGAPAETVDAITSALRRPSGSAAQRSSALVLGLVTTLFGATGAFNSAGQALNRVWRVEEGRGYVKRKLVNLLWTLTLLALMLVTLVLVFLGGDLAADVLGLIGLGDNAATVWAYVRWPAALLSAMLIYAIVYYAAPNVEVRNWRYITPGAALRGAGLDPRLGRVLLLRLGVCEATRPPTARSPLS